MAVLEIFTFPASEAYQKDPHLNRDVFELIIRISKGLQRYVIGDPPLRSYTPLPGLVHHPMLIKT